VRQEGAVVVLDPGFMGRVCVGLSAVNRSIGILYEPLFTLKSVPIAVASVTGMTIRTKTIPLGPSSLARCARTALICPPAEKPPILILDTSTPSDSPCWETYCRASQQSSTGIGKRCSGARRYPTSTTTHPVAAMALRIQDSSSPIAPRTQPRVSLYIGTVLMRLEKTYLRHGCSSVRGVTDPLAR
jgi:hypothetical protein